MASEPRTYRAYVGVNKERKSSYHYNKDQSNMF